MPVMIFGNEYFDGTIITKFRLIASS